MTETEIPRYYCEYLNFFEIYKASNNANLELFTRRVTFFSLELTGFWLALKLLASPYLPLVSIVCGGRAGGKIVIKLLIKRKGCWRSFSCFLGMIWNRVTLDIRAEFIGIDPLSLSSSPTEPYLFTLDSGAFFPGFWWYGMIWYDSVQKKIH